MLAVLVLSLNEESGQRLAAGLVRETAKAKAEEAVQVIGPAPAVISRIGDQYRTVFYAKSVNRAALIAAKDRMEILLEMQKPQKETVQFDFDPVNGY